MSNTPLVRVTGAGKTYGPRTVFADVSFDVAAGQVAVLTGPSGAGKSSLLNCVGLLDSLTHGSISLNGEQVESIGTSRRTELYRTTIGFLFQNYALIEDETVQGNLAIAWIGQKASRAERAEKDAHALEAVGLSSNRLQSPVVELSGGEQQRVALARLIIRQPRLIIADEPTGALDRRSAATVLKILRGFANRRSAVLIASHDRQVIDTADVLVELGAVADTGVAARRA
jgi:putative ABC transport system ATP-binding protein